MERVIHICMVCGQYPPEIGGIATHCKWLVDNLKKEGIRVSVITRGPKSKRNKNVWKINSKYLQPIHLLDFGKKAKKIIRKIEPDIVHVHSPGVYLPRLDIPIITSVHTTVEMEKRTLGFDSLYGAYVNILSPVLKIVEKDLFKKSDKIIAVSQNTQKKLVKSYLLPKNKVVVIHNGVSNEFFHIKRKPKRYKLLFIGNLIKRKNLQMLLKAMVKLEDEFHDIQLNVVGDGPMKNKLEKMSKRLNLKKVNFRGNVNNSELIEFLSTSEVLIIPSRYEDFPMVILESLACGLPVIASRVGGIPEIIPDKYLFSPDNGKDIRDKISNYLRSGEYDLPLIDLMKLSGKTHTLKFIELYQSLLDKSAHKLGLLDPNHISLQLT